MPWSLAAIKKDIQEEKDPKFLDQKSLRRSTRMGNLKKDHAMKMKSEHDNPTPGNWMVKAPPWILNIPSQIS